MTQLKLAEGEKIIRRYMTLVGNDQGRARLAWVYEIMKKNGGIRVEVEYLNEKGGKE